LQLRAIAASFSHLFYPSICFACGKKEIEDREFICLDCSISLPYTGFEQIRDNPVEKLFWGRCRIQFASSSFYYVEKTSLQQLIHQVKYKEQEKLGIYLGQKMGSRLQFTFERNEVDLLIPMPLHPKKLKSRGYNQASLLCEGITNKTGCAFDETALIRTENTSTQTKKTRMDRWKNVNEVFAITKQENILDKNIVLVDDVITTGASTEACAQTLLQHGAKSVAICSLAFTL